MTWDQQQQSDGDHSGDDLDALLADAVWPEVDGARVARLSARWDGIVRRRTRQRRWVTGAALIGCLASATALYQFRSADVPPTDARSPAGEQMASYLHQPLPTIDPPAQDLAEHAEAPRSLTRSTDEDPAAVAAARAAAEQMVLITLDRRMRRRAERPHGKGDAAVEKAIAEVRTRGVVACTLHATLSATTQVPLGRSVQFAFASALTDAALPNIDQIADRLRAGGRRHEESLTAVIRQAGGPRRVAAIRLLTRIATQRSLPFLIQLCRDPAASRAATAAIARLADPWTLYRLAKAAPSLEVRRQLMAALLNRGGQRPVALFLGLVQDPTTAPDALQSLGEVTTPPVDTLLQFFAAPRVSYRRAAAQVLGQLPDPAISEALVAMVLRNQHQREALLALSARHDPLATEFIRRAYNDMALTALVRAAQLRSERATTPKQI